MQSSHEGFIGYHRHPITVNSLLTGCIVWTFFLLAVVYFISSSTTNPPVQATVETKKSIYTKEYFDELPEIQQKIIIDKYAELHPQIQAIDLSTDDSIDIVKTPLSQQTRSLRNKLMECVITIPQSTLPVFEGNFGDDWWQARNAKCETNGRPYYSIHREQNIAKILYCLARNTDFKVFMTPIMGYGSAALQVAAGIAHAKVSDRTLFAFESHSQRYQVANVALQKFNQKIKPNEFSVSDCIRAPVSLLFIDYMEYHPEKARAKIRTLKDGCAPQMTLVFNIPENVYPKIFTQVFPDWEIVMQGSSKGAGCFPNNFESLRWILVSKTGSTFRHDLFIQLPE